MADPVRACGSCTACCVVLGVSELAKGLHEACARLSPTGCATYADRPTSCRTFRCQWLRGLLEVDGAVDPELRPDACGVIFDFQPLTEFGDVYMAWEVERDASVDGPAGDVIAELAERFLVVVTSPREDGETGQVERSFLGPSGLVARASHQTRMIRQSRSDAQ